MDVSEATGRDPVHDFEIVMEELASFSEDLAQKPMMVVATKIDAAQDPARVASLEKLARERGLPFFKISSVTGEGFRCSSAPWRMRCSRLLAILQPPSSQTGSPLTAERASHFRVISSITSSGRVVYSQNTCTAWAPRTCIFKPPLTGVNFRCSGPDSDRRDNAQPDLGDVQAIPSGFDGDNRVRDDGRMASVELRSL